jgi:hypothetical protein
MIQNEIDLDIFQGADFEIELEHLNNNNTPINLTGCSITGQIRPCYTSDIKYDFSGSVTNAALGLSKISMANTVLSSIKSKETLKYVYDIELTFPDSKKVKIARGKAYIYPEVTR